MNKQMTNHWGAVLLALLLMGTACSDHILDDFINPATDEDGMAFSVSTVEQADLIYSMGKTRAATLAADGTFLRANDNPVYPLRGGEDLGLYLHRMPLPMVGIHPRSVAPSAAAGTTRASLGEIAGDGINFHDSLTIWGYTSEPYKTTGKDDAENRTVFKQILLTKVRGFRSSALWPYGGKRMKYYAVSPAMESQEDLQVLNTPSYGLAPSFSYKVPAEPAYQRDLLFGESGEIDVEAGPSNPNPLYPDAENEREQHLGQDDKEVNLQFEHILTAVRFAQGTIPKGVTIKRIRLYDIASSGTYTLGDGWTPDESAKATYEIVVEHTIVGKEVEKPEAGESHWNDNAYIDGEQVLFLLPQDLAKNEAAQLQVTLDYEGTERNLTAQLNDLWRPGYTVTYKVSVGEMASDYYLLVGAKQKPDETEGAGEYDHEGFSGTLQTGQNVAHEHSTVETTGSYTIHSYRLFKTLVEDSDEGEGYRMGDAYHSVPWKVTGFYIPKDPNLGLQEDEKEGWFSEETKTTDQHVPNEWLKSITGWVNLSGSSVGEPSPVDASQGPTYTLTYQLTPQEKKSILNHASVLGGNALASTADLSTTLPDGTTELKGEGSSPKTTANCYIVNAQGTYTFPLVYGNAYNGSNTIRTSSNDATTFNPGNLFVDHSGRPITEGRILKQVDYEETKEVTPTEEEKADYGEDVKVTETKKVEYNHSAGDITAEIVWQDVSSIQFSCNGVRSVSDAWQNGDTDGAIEFEVKQTVQTVQPGNCVIALKGRKTETVTRKNKTTGKILKSVETTSPTSEILWTWHIWCTDEVYRNSGDVNEGYPLVNTPDGTHLAELGGEMLMPVNLGWVPDSNNVGVYKPREVWVEVEQTKSKSKSIAGTTEKEPSQKIHLRIRQEAKQDPLRGVSTVYQWGRPTALPMTRYVNYRAGGTPDEQWVRPVYGGESNNSISESGVNIMSLIANQEALTNPLSFARHSTVVAGEYPYSWYPMNTEEKLWSSTTKTLYDPCPPGFQLPSAKVFKIFSQTGENTGGLSEMNIWNDPDYAQDYYGSFFYTQKHPDGIPAEDRYGTMLYLPATGYWESNVGVGSNVSQRMIDHYQDNAHGYYWLGDWNATNQRGYYFYLGPSGGVLKFQEETYLNTAMPIRPVKSKSE